MSNIRKVWGIRYRLLESDQVEVDLLYLEKKSACSIHSHKNKINRFVLLSGSVTIKSDIGEIELVINEPFDIEPPRVHQFVILQDSVMIELAFVKDGTIDLNDIDRKQQGGKFIKDKFYTLEQLIENNWMAL